MVVSLQFREAPAWVVPGNPATFDIALDADVVELGTDGKELDATKPGGSQ